MPQDVNAIEDLGPPELDSPVPDSPEPDSPEPDSPEPDSPEPDSPEPDSPEPDSPEPGRGRRRGAKGEQTRRAIVEAALRLFREHGYEATTMRDPREV